MTDGHPSGSVTRLRELARHGAMVRHQDAICVESSWPRGGHSAMFGSCDHPDCRLVRDELAAALAPAVVPSVDDFVVPVEVVNRQMADMSAMIRKLEHERDAAETVMLEELHGLVASMNMRVEVLGGQRTTYVQRATLLDWIEVELEKRLKSAAPPVVAPVAAPVVPSVDEILRNMISGEESCARPRPAYLRALRDVRKVLAAAPPVVAPVAHEHVYRMDPVTETAFCECGQTVTLAESVAPVAAPVQEQADDLCGRCGYQRFRHTAYYQREHGQTMPAAPQICNAFTSPSLPLTGGRAGLEGRLDPLSGATSSDPLSGARLRRSQGKPRLYASLGDLIAHVGCGDVDNFGKCRMCDAIREALRDAPPRPQGESDE